MAEPPSSSEGTGPFDIHAGPYSPSRLDSLPLDELRAIRREILVEQRAALRALRDELDPSTPLVEQDDYYARGLDLGDAFYVPILMKRGTRYHLVDPVDSPDLWSWRERARAVQAAPAYRTWIEERRRTMLADIERNLGLAPTDLEIVTSPSDDKFVVFGTVGGMRRRIGEQNDLTSY